LYAEYPPNLQHQNADDQKGTDEGREIVQRELGTLSAKIQKEGLSNSQSRQFKFLTNNFVLIP
jgi:hypothetical protein